MADISKCLVGESCAQRGRCYRFTAPDTPGWQAYSMPVVTADGCQSFMANDDYRKAANEGNKEATNS